tara:strand:- start:575 stop:835 length:261 start_codon:yes stop_codon:yes gene_type:complete
MKNQHSLIQQLNNHLNDVLPVGQNANLQADDWIQLLSESISEIRNEFQKSFDKNLIDKQREDGFQKSFDWVKEDIKSLDFLLTHLK